MKPDPLPLTELARRIGATPDDPTALEGVFVTGLTTPTLPHAGHVVTIDDAEQLQATLNASNGTELAALVAPPHLEVPQGAPPVLRHDAPRLAFARLTTLFDAEARPAPGRAASAIVADDAHVAADVTLAPHVVIGSGANVEAGCIIDAGCIIGPDVHVGAGTRLFPHVTLYPGVRLGARVRVHAGAVIGADGFGYAAGPDGAEKVHHLGTVVIEDDVEIGANTTIDRGTLGATRIGAGSKIDNLCQIGHNVEVGRHTLIAGTVAIGGTTRIGDGVRIGGGARISDHLTVHDGASLAGGSGLSKDIPAGETWGGLPATPMRQWVRERYLIGNLERIWQFVRTATRNATRSETPDA